MRRKVVLKYGVGLFFFWWFWFSPIFAGLLRDHDSMPFFCYWATDTGGQEEKKKVGLLGFCGWFLFMAFDDLLVLRTSFVATREQFPVNAIEREKTPVVGFLVRFVLVGGVPVLRFCVEFHDMFAAKTKSNGRVIAFSNHSGVQCPGQ